ncbi:hypothetical protein GM418_27145 [Maribellus comscasis]|uniref:ThuA-like domain-containing protein n=1 Tax=Maribellus comscasis TaxID=2681766 RepID=A0A6I6K3Q1_9BACT|nr:ThuA domain-containing protein [Maribellus comscasis]QGY47207.1 hypothetical protein GM418_27145 [Maribellus comscasis]
MKYRGLTKIVFVILISINLISPSGVVAQNNIQVLNFQADNGYEHPSKDEAIAMVEKIGSENGWNVVSTSDTSIINLGDLLNFDVIVFNNNCGTDGRIFSQTQQQSIQQYIRNGGGFVGIHCAGAIWMEGGQFQQWYEKLIGTKLVAHPEVQQAKLIVEDKRHICTAHLPDEWILTDEWHWFSYNPRENVNVLISLDENSYEGGKKMGDHPFTWYQHYDGGRSFFTSLGHTEEIYSNEDYEKLVEGGIIWAAGYENLASEDILSDGLLLDLDADKGILLDDGNKIISWANQANNQEVRDFIIQDEGRETAGSGRPVLKMGVSKLNGHNSVIFHRQELVNHNEDAFDHLITGSGHTWFSVMAVYEQVPGLKDVNSFFGNLRNGGKYEGIWGCVTDDNRPWTGGRNGITFGRWDENNPMVLAEEPLETAKYYIVAGRMGSGSGTVNSELFINSAEVAASKPFPVNSEANSSKMAIGQERDAIEHPGKESFDGEIARFLIYERPLSDDEMKSMFKRLAKNYDLKILD